MTRICQVSCAAAPATRMWPESPESVPERFIPLIGQWSGFQSIVGVVSEAAVLSPAVSRPLDQIMNMKHELAQLAGKIDWDFIDGEIAFFNSEKDRPGIEIKLELSIPIVSRGEVLVISEATSIRI